jgi:predicted  nucleic acid-binding Zn-ribbon protein|tara:strand:- start:1010 stop:1720 length:711 start_codon:yes stop_codon:yes gene_type:complete
MSMQRLIELQEIDRQLQDLNSLLGDLPKKVNEMNEKEELLRTNLKNNKIRLKEIQVEFHKSEVKAAEIDGKINKIKDQLFLVTNNKQYDALMHEIDHLREEKSRLESEILTYLEEKDKFVNNIENEGTQLKSLADKLITRKKKLEIALSESAGEKSALEQKRQDKVKQIDPHNIALYNQVSAARNGLAVVHLSGSSCSGCGAAITMQTVSEIRSRNAIYRCDVCSRFVYSNHNSIN